MTYSYDRRLGSEEIDTSGLFEKFLARIDSSVGPDWEEFKKDVRDLGPTSFEKPGGPNTLQTVIYVRSGGHSSNRSVPNAKDVYHSWDLTRRLERAREEEEHLKRTTWEVAYFRGTKFGKYERIPKDLAETPWKPGHLLLDESAQIQGHGFDSDFGPTLNLRSKTIGSEISQGTVVGKRIILMPDKRVQYLIKPRSGRAEKVYQAKVRLQQIERSLLTMVDYLTPEDFRKLHEEKEKLLKLVK